MPRLARYLALGLAVLGLGFCALLLFPPQPILGWVADRNPEVLFYVETERPVVALTIDDGPHSELTPAILDLLEAHDAKATFFLIGDHIEGNEELLERMSGEGHELANHLGSDVPSIGLSDAEFARQLVSVDSMIAFSGDAKWFRPGSGWYDDGMLAQLADHGYRCSLGSFYPIAPLLKNPRLFAEQILQRVQAGAILILHEGAEDRAPVLEVLERILPEIKSRGYEITTLSELVALEGETL